MALLSMVAISKSNYKWIVAVIFAVVFLCIIRISNHRQPKINPIDGAEWVDIPAGVSYLGEAGRADNPRHKVILSEFRIYKTPVTVTQYFQFLIASGYVPKDNYDIRNHSPDFNPGWIHRDQPIVRVSWDDAQEYCKWAHVKLPTEAQWERAAKGTLEYTYPWGNTWDGSKCANSVFGELVGAVKVGNYPHGKSPDNVLDMAGNVWQWCRDTYDSEFWKNSHLESNPVNLTDSNKPRVLHGGSWNGFVPDWFRSSYRLNYNHQTRRYYGTGFRCISGP